MVLEVKNPPAKAGDARKVGSIPGWGRFPAVRIGIPLQYSCLEISMDREAWWATVHEVTKGQTQLSEHTHNQIPWPNSELRVWEIDSLNAEDY